jgi:hypothetical protein
MQRLRKAVWIEKGVLSLTLPEPQGQRGEQSQSSGDRKASGSAAIACWTSADDFPPFSDGQRWPPFCCASARQVLCSCPFWHYISAQTEAIILHMFFICNDYQY